MPGSSSYSSVTSGGSASKTAIHEAGCRSVLFTVFANTTKLYNPIFDLRMGDKRVTTSPEMATSGTRVFGSVTMPYLGEKKVMLEAINKSGKSLGKHTFDLKKIPNIYSYYDGTVELTKKGKVLGTLNIRIDFSKKKVTKIVDRKGMFALCHGPNTANFENDVKKKGNLCNAVVSDGSSLDNGRRKIFLNKSGSSKSSNARMRKMRGASAKKTGSRSGSSSRGHPVAKAGAYGTALKSSLSGDSHPKGLSHSTSSSKKLAKTSSSSSHKGVSPVAAVAAAAAVVAVPALNHSKSSSSSKKKGHSISSSVDVDAHIVKPKPNHSSSLESTRRRRGKSSPKSSPVPHSSTTVSKSKFNCGKVCGSKKETGTVPTPHSDLNSSKKRKRTGRKVPKSNGVSPAQRSDSCSSVRSRKSIASSCSGRRKAKKDSSSHSASCVPVVSVGVAGAAAATAAHHSRSSSDAARVHKKSSSSSSKAAPSIKSTASSRRRRTTKQKPVSSVTGSRRSMISCASSKGSRLSCVGKKNKVVSRSQSNISDLSSVADIRH